MKPHCKYHVIAVDTHSGKTTEKGDPAAMLCLARGEDGFAYIVGYDQGRWDPDELRYRLYVFYERMGRLLGARNNSETSSVGRMVVVEDTNLGPWLFQEIGKVNQRSPDTYMPARLQKTGRASKKLRAIPVASQIVRGRIRLPQDAPFTNLIQRQWFTLGMPGVHDEAVDCLSMAFKQLIVEDELIGHPLRLPLLPMGKGLSFDEDAARRAAMEQALEQLNDANYERETDIGGFFQDEHRQSETMSAATRLALQRVRGGLDVNDLDQRMLDAIDPEKQYRR